MRTHGGPFAAWRCMMSANVNISCEIGGMQRFADQLLRVEMPARLAMGKNLVEAGKTVKAEADKRARQRMPNKAPRISVVSYGTNMVQIKAEGSLGKLFEAGGKGGTAGNPAKWRHPLFGNTGYWYNQKVDPYLVPAMTATKPLVLAKMILDLNIVLDTYLTGIFTV